MDITKEKIRRIIDAGARVILTTKGIDDLCLKYFVEAGSSLVFDMTIIISYFIFLLLFYHILTRTSFAFFFKTFFISFHFIYFILLYRSVIVVMVFIAGAIAVRRVKPEDLKRIAKATGGQVVATMVSDLMFYRYILKLNLCETIFILYLLR